MKGKSKSMCSGCRNNFYNGHNDLGVKECWSFKDAKPVTKWAIGWWTPMDRPENFRKVRVLDCYHQPGQCAYLQDLPEHIKAMKRRKPRKATGGAS